MEQEDVLGASETTPGQDWPSPRRIGRDARAHPDTNLYAWTGIERPVLALEHQFGDRLGVERQMMG